MANLIISDYRTRLGRVPEGTMDHRREMIEWKFDQMDVDRNGKQKLAAVCLSLCELHASHTVCRVEI